VERPESKDLSILVSAQSSRHTGDSNSCPPDLELGTLTKWLASRMLVGVSRQASLQAGQLRNPFPDNVG
jgi:hypothetical protein